MIRLPACLAVVALLCLTVLTGCGDGVSRSVVKVNVTSTKVKLDDTDSISVGFTPEAAGGETAVAGGEARKLPLLVKASAKDATGVAPGKYKLTVSISPYAGMANANPAHAPELKALSDQFDAKNSKLTYEVVAGKEQTITIDLDTGTVK
jgi:hypothetical protein